MTCNNCEAENPPGRSTCTVCSQPLGQNVKSESKITKKGATVLPVKRQPGSPLYVIRGLEPKTNFWGKVTSVPDPVNHGLDLSTVDRHHWSEIFDSIFRENDSFLLSPSLGEYWSVYESASEHISFPTGPGNTVCFQINDEVSETLKIWDTDAESTDEKVAICYDFLQRPSELLDLYNWELTTDESLIQEPTSSKANSSRAAYVEPITTTTFIATDGFEF